MIRFPIPLALILAFAPQEAHGECVTVCGISAPGSSCDALQGMETRTLLAFQANVPGWSYARTCPVLKGWHVIRHRLKGGEELTCPMGERESRPWFESNMWVVGMTWPRDRLVEVSTLHWRTNSFAHELAHVLQTELGEPVGHCLWKERGVLLALLVVGSTEYPTFWAPECDPSWKVGRYGGP